MVGRKYWRWIRLSPLVVFAALAVLGVLLPKNVNDNVVAYIWFTVALVSLYCAHRVMRRAKILKIVAQEDYLPNHPVRNETEFDHSLAIMVVWLHVMFASVGAAAAFVPDAYEEIRTSISRDNLLLGQYILFLIVCRQYLTLKKLDEWLNQGVKRGKVVGGHQLEE